MRHFRPVNLVVTNAAKFNTFVCAENQFIREFFAELKMQAPKCRYRPQMDVQLQDRLIAGIRMRQNFSQGHCLINIRRFVIYAKSWDNTRVSTVIDNFSS